MLKGLSMFSNVGIAETYLKKININIIIATEINKQRAKFYSHLWPETNMILGDIKDNKIFNKIIDLAIKEKVDFILATPPCQGMSLAGKNDWRDERNELINYVIDAILKIKPKYVFIENVPSFLKTKIKLENKIINIDELINKRLGSLFNINSDIVDAAEYGVPQHRKRCIVLLTRNDIKRKLLLFKSQNTKLKTVKEAIGDLPSLDPIVYDYENLENKNIVLKENTKIKYHWSPRHCWRHVKIMMHTPTGQTAFNNTDLYKPRKKNGEIVSGFYTTYKRMEWDKPAPTITMGNGSISSQNNVHPGRLKSDNTYSDARALTILEIMRLTGLPDDWNIPKWASEKFIRSVIGEGIPPLMVYKILEQIKDVKDE